MPHKQLVRTILGQTWKRRRALLRYALFFVVWAGFAAGCRGGKTAPQLAATHGKDSRRQVAIARQVAPRTCVERGPRPYASIDASDTGLTANSAHLSSAGILRCKWDKDTLRVAFLDGDASTQQRVAAAAAEWTPFSNVTFAFGVPASSADIRITFNYINGDFSGNWSYIGNCGLPASPAPTMQLAQIDFVGDPRYSRAAVLHEFGHVLGLIHEHASPASPIHWNREALIRDHCWGKTGDALSRCEEGVQINIIDKEADPSLNYTAYDPESIMHYPVWPGETTDGFQHGWNYDLSALDRSFMKIWYAKGLWQGWTAPEEEYLFGNWDGYRGSNVAVRRKQCVLEDINYDGIHDMVQCFGLGSAENQYLVGDWNGDGKAKIAVRRGNCVHFSLSGGPVADRAQCYGYGNTDQYFAGHWYGGKVDTLAVRRGNCLHIDLDGDGKADRTQCFGNGGSEDQYLVGDWNGDGRTKMAVRRGNCVHMALADGTLEHVQCFGLGNRDAYVVGDWDGDGKDDLGVRRGNCIHMDYNGDTAEDKVQCYGNGAIN